MTFRTGFAVTQDLSLTAWRLENAAGRPLQGSVRRPPRANRGTMLEIDTQRGRARVPFGRGAYLATDLTPDLRRAVVNLAEYAASAIDAIMKAQDADAVRAAVTGWVEDKQRFCWTRNIPWQLEMSDLEVGQRFRATRVTDRELFFVTDNGARAFEWTVAIGDINLEDVAVDDDRAVLERPAGLPLKDLALESAAVVAGHGQWSLAS